jgi:hypothetical protein
MDVDYIIFGPTVRRVGAYDDIGRVEFNRDHDITGRLSYLMLILLWYHNLDRMGVSGHGTDMRSAYREREIARIKSSI